MAVGLVLVRPRRFGDDRGWFTEVYSERRFAALGIDARFIQDNHSLSALTCTIRGLHFQTPPFAQAKLVRCISGRIFDVAVDLRKGSPTYGRWLGVELSAANGDQLYIPAGYAHGFITLEPHTEVTYKVSEVYAPANDSGILWSDASIGIAWPNSNGITPTLSAKDEKQPPLSAFDSPFEYDGTPMHLAEA